MIPVKNEFTPFELRCFGPLFALFAGLIAAMIVRHFAAHRIATLVVVMAALIIVVYYLVPAWQRAIFRGWMLSVAPLGFVISYLLLALVYYGLVTPIGMILRLCGYDPLTRRIDDRANSYWTGRGDQRPERDYFRQF